jgi:hypothetical protein
MRKQLSSSSSSSSSSNDDGAHQLPDVDPSQLEGWFQATDEESHAGTCGGRVTPLRSVKTSGLHFQVFAASL